MYGHSLGLRLVLKGMAADALPIPISRATETGVRTASTSYA